MKRLNLLGILLFSTLTNMALAQDIISAANIVSGGCFPDASTDANQANAETFAIEELKNTNNGGRIILLDKDNKKVTAYFHTASRINLVLEDRDGKKVIKDDQNLTIQFTKSGDAVVTDIEKTLEVKPVLQECKEPHNSGELTAKIADLEKQNQALAQELKASQDALAQAQAKANKPATAAAPAPAAAPAAKEEAPAPLPSTEVPATEVANNKSSKKQQLPNIVKRPWWCFLTFNKAKACSVSKYL
jgi:hypothetical protein